MKKNIFLLLLTGFFLLSGNYLFIVVKGSPRQMGRQYGEAVKENFQQFFPEFRKIMEANFQQFSFFKRPLVRLFFSWKKRKLEKYVPLPYIEEMKGLAESTGANYNDIFTLNVLYEFLHSCSAFAFKDRKGRLIHGRNLDYYLPESPLGNRSIIIFYIPEKGLSYLSITFLGLTGTFSGVNEKGLAVTLNEVSTGKGKTFSHIPATFLIKSILQNCSDLKCAETLIARSKIFPGINLLISSAKDDKAAVFEIAKGKYRRRDMKGDFIVVTNHFVTEKMKPLSTTGFPGGSLKRYKRLVFLLNHHSCPEGIMCLKDLQDVQTGKLCLWGHTINRPMTMQSMVFYNKEGKVRLAMGNGYAPDRRWIEIDFRETKRTQKPVYETIAEESLTPLQKDFLRWQEKLWKTKNHMDIARLSQRYFQKTSYPFFAYMQARFLLSAGKPKQSWKALKEAEKEGLLTDFLLHLKATISLKLDRPEEAEKALVQLSKFGEEALYYKALLLFSLGDYWKKKGERSRAFKYFREFKKLVFLHKAYSSPSFKKLLQKAS